MKKILYFCAAALALTFVGCSSQKDIDVDMNGGKGAAFVHFANASDSWLVQADDESYDFEVVVGQTFTNRLYKSYAVTVGEKTTGVEGRDFVISDKSVTIAAGEYTGTVKVHINYDEIPNEFNFVIELVLSDVDKEKVSPIYGTSTLVKVNTDKINFDWDWLLGTWDAVDFNLSEQAVEGDSYPVVISKEDDTHVTITNVWGTEADLVGCEVDFEARTITIPGYQFCIDYTGYNYGLFYFIAVDPDAEYDYFYDDNGDPDFSVPVVAKMSAGGIVIDNYDFVMIGGQYDGYTYDGGIRTTLTR